MNLGRLWTALTDCADAVRPENRKTATMIVLVRIALFILGWRVQIRSYDLTIAPFSAGEKLGAADVTQARRLLLALAGHVRPLRCDRPGETREEVSR
jgi:hypothetical protein